jgi:hypothetical protein
MTRRAGFAGSDLRTLAIWLAPGLFMMAGFLRAPLGEQG